MSLAPPLPDPPSPPPNPERRIRTQKRRQQKPKEGVLGSFKLGWRPFLSNPYQLKFSCQRSRIKHHMKVMVEVYRMAHFCKSGNDLNLACYFPVCLGKSLNQLRFVVRGPVFMAEGPFNGAMRDALRRLPRFVCPCALDG